MVGNTLKLIEPQVNSFVIVEDTLITLNKDPLFIYPYIVVHRKAAEEIEVEVELNKNGLKIGKRLHRYSDMNHFWIFHELHELHIRLNNTMGMPVSISIPENPTILLILPFL